MKLLDETLEYLEGKGIDPEKEVKWVGSRDGKYAMSFAEFAKKFAELYYDANYGRQEIAKDLVVVGEDWWLERGEYDGSEWWELKKTPILSSAPKNFNCVRGNSLDPMLEDLNKDNGEQGDIKAPLIEDEKIRKAVRAWAEACDIEKCHYDGDGDFATRWHGIKLDGSQIELDDGHYSIAELCGDEEE